MARNKYYVLSNGGRWKVRHNDKDYDFATQAEAIRASVDAAHTSGKQGIDSQVLVQGQGGQWRTEWTYGNDPYPPKG